MNLQIGMRANGIRFVYDRDKIPDDVETYALDFGDTCPPDAIEADGFTDVKSARAYMKKRGAGAGEPAITWRRVKARDGTAEHHMFIDERHVATVFNEGDKTDPAWVVRDVVKDEEDTGYESCADAKESAECLMDGEASH